MAMIDAVALLAPPRLEELPMGPLMVRWVLEEPLLPTVLIGVLAVGVLIALRRAGRPRAAVAAGGIGVLLIAGLVVVERLVVTGRERVAEIARELVLAVERGDVPAASELLSERVTLDLVGVGRGAGKGRIVANIPRLHVVVDVGRLRVWEVRAGLLSRSIARTQVRVKPDSPDLPRDSWWRIDWALEPGAEGEETWRATRIEPLWILGLSDPGG